MVTTDEVGRDAGVQTTVETEIRARISGWLGGPRGSLETAVPFVAFTVAFVVTDELVPAIVIGITSSVVLLGLRLAQRTSTQFVRNGLFAIAFSAVIATVTGRAEAAFLPSIVQSTAWAVVFGVSILVGRPVAGYLIGAAIDDRAGWLHDPAIVRLANHLTLVFMVAMSVRVAVQYPLYLAGEVAWLGVSRVALGWPLSGVALAVAAAILARGRTPLPQSAAPGASET